MTEPIHGLLAMLVIFIIPSFIWFVNGEAEDNFDHMFVFMILGVILVVPTVIALEEAVLPGLYEHGFVAAPNATMCEGVQQEGCVADTSMLAALIGFGVLVYYLTYKAGCAMNEVWHYEG